MLLLERMDVHRWSAHSGPNPTQQRPARIPSGLPELYRVPLNWVVELLSCPRHSSYTSSRSPPKRCEHCINPVRAREHGPALASSWANFRELREREVRLVPVPMGENFSGSCIVTSRNPLIHIGATPATKSECFDPKGVQQGLLSWGWRCVEESLATANFREFFF